MSRGFSWSRLQGHWQGIGMTAACGALPLLFGEGSVHGAYGMVFLFFLSVLAALDVSCGKVYNRLLWPMALAGMAHLLAAAAAGGDEAMADALAGVLLGLGLLLSVRCLSRGGLGGGDVKLAAVLGLWLGWKALLAALYIAFFGGALAAAGMLACGARERSLPFAPFLALGAYVAYLYGMRLWLAYEECL